METFRQFLRNSLRVQYGMLPVGIDDSIQYLYGLMKRVSVQVCTSVRAASITHADSILPIRFHPNEPSTFVGAIAARLNMVVDRSNTVSSTIADMHSRLLKQTRDETAAPVDTQTLAMFTRLRDDWYMYMSIVTRGLGRAVETYETSHHMSYEDGEMNKVTWLTIFTNQLWGRVPPAIADSANLECFGKVRGFARILNLDEANTTRRLDILRTDYTKVVESQAMYSQMVINHIHVLSYATADTNAKNAARFKQLCKDAHTHLESLDGGAEKDETDELWLDAVAYAVSDNGSPDAANSEDDSMQRIREMVTTDITAHRDKIVSELETASASGSDSNGIDELKDLDGYCKHAITTAEDWYQQVYTAVPATRNHVVQFLRTQLVACIRKPIVPIGALMHSVLPGSEGGPLRSLLSDIKSTCSMVWGATNALLGDTNGDQYQVDVASGAQIFGQLLLHWSNLYWRKRIRNFYAYATANANLDPGQLSINSLINGQTITGATRSLLDPTGTNEKAQRLIAFLEKGLRGIFDEIIPTTTIQMQRFVTDPIGASIVRSMRQVVVDATSGVSIDQTPMLQRCIANNKSFTKCAEEAELVETTIIRGMQFIRASLHVFLTNTVDSNGDPMLVDHLDAKHGALPVQKYDVPEPFDYKYTYQYYDVEAAAIKIIAAFKGGYGTGARQIIARFHDLNKAAIDLNMRQLAKVDRVAVLTAHVQSLVDTFIKSRERVTHSSDMAALSDNGDDRAVQALYAFRLISCESLLQQWFYPFQ